jgi:hypothetical protein
MHPWHWRRCPPIRPAPLALTSQAPSPSAEYWEGKRGACVGAFQQVIAQKERKEALREVVAILKSTRNPQVSRRRDRYCPSS